MATKPLTRTPHRGRVALGDLAARVERTDCERGRPSRNDAKRRELGPAVVLGRGDVIGGFEIQGVVRSGPRGVVYEAVESGGEGRVVALRVLDLRLSHDPAFVERFRKQEWPEHPHIVSVFETGEWEHGLFVAMQLVLGDTIAELLALGGLDQSRALAALTDVAGALDSAHERGLAHGWVRPEAVLIDEAGTTWLVDFGLFPGTATPAEDLTAFAALVRTCLGKRSVPRGSWETASAIMAMVSDRLGEQPAAGGGGGWRRRLRRGGSP